MNKKFVLKSILLGGLLFLSQEVLAQTSNVILNWGGDDNGIVGDMPRGPVEPLMIGIDDHTLYMSNVSFNATVQLLDSDGVVVYTTYFVAYTSTLVLPSTYEGSYELRLLRDDYYYYGYIEL